MILMNTFKVTNAPDLEAGRNPYLFFPKTLDKIPALPIIPPDMVTFLQFRDFLFVPAGMAVFFVL
jgi:hypothetical protein